MILIIMGAPGSGKGTTCDAMSREYNIPKVSTGDILRREVKEKTVLGLKVKEILERGVLVPDDIINEILKNKLHQNGCNKGFMLDGFPRTINQAEELEKILKELKYKLDLVINLVVSEELILKRLTNRRVCRKCNANFNLVSAPPKQQGICDIDSGELYQRADDTEEVIKNRLKVYVKDTQPLINYYTKKGLLRSIDAEGGVDNVMDILKVLLKKGRLFKK